jgi:hypothetical protein
MNIPINIKLKQNKKEEEQLEHFIINLTKSQSIFVGVIYLQYYLLLLHL